VNKRILGIAVTVLAITLLATPAFAKNLNTEPSTVFYYDGGKATVALPVPLTGYPPATWPQTTTATSPKMLILFTHIQIPNAAEKIDCYGLLFQFWSTSSVNHTPHWEPFAYVTSDSGAVPYTENFWKGSYIEFPGTYYNNLYHITTFKDTYNIFVVTPQELTVERHGNNVAVNLDKAITITRPNGITFTVPKFNLVLNGYGDSIVQTESKTLSSTGATGYYNAPNVLFEAHNRGFMANGYITCTTWNYAGTSTPISDAMVIMQGIQTTTPLT
jgi:hypothetical protein